MRSTLTAKEQLLAVLREFVVLDLRWSHFVVAGMVVLGGAINLLVPHGWTVWPFVFGAAMMTKIHEAADRHGQGVPPLHVYGVFVSVMLMWLSLAFILSVVNPVVILLGVIVLGYHCVRGYIKKREHDRLVAWRLAEGLCIYCGTAINPEFAYCESCGEEPDPQSARLERITAIIKNPLRSGHARAVLRSQPPAVTAAQKEQALLARHHGRQRRK